MENQNRWNLEVDAVLSAVEAPIYRDLRTGTVEELMLRLKGDLRNDALLGAEIPCRVLEPGKPWRQGKVKLVIQFSPDEPSLWS